MRKRVYPRWVAANRMSEPEAAREIATMQSIIDLLRSLNACQFCGFVPLDPATGKYGCPNCHGEGLT